MMHDEARKARKTLDPKILNQGGQVTPLHTSCPMTPQGHLNPSNPCQATAAVRSSARAAVETEAAVEAASSLSSAMVKNTAIESCRIISTLMMIQCHVHLSVWNLYCACHCCWLWNDLDWTFIALWNQEGAQDCSGHTSISTTTAATTLANLPSGLFCRQPHFAMSQVTMSFLCILIHFKLAKLHCDKLPHVLVDHLWR